MEIENQILKVIHCRAPNAVRIEWIRSELNEFSMEDIDNALKKMEKEEAITSNTDTRGGLLSAVKYYKLSDYNNIPVKETINVGGTDVHRLLSVSSPTNFPEEFNESIQELSKYSASLEGRFTNLVKKEQNKYWGQVITIFGAFVALLSIIIVGLPKITTDPNLPFWSIVQLNVAQLLPIVFVMVVFVVVLKWMFK